jgi:hypothetical protein
MNDHFSKKDLSRIRHLIHAQVTNAGHPSPDLADTDLDLDLADTDLDLDLAGTDLGLDSVPAFGRTQHSILDFASLSDHTADFDHPVACHTAAMPLAADTQLAADHTDHTAESHNLADTQ